MVAARQARGAQAKGEHYQARAEQAERATKAAEEAAGAETRSAAAAERAAEAQEKQIGMNVGLSPIAMTGLDTPAVAGPIDAGTPILLQPSRSPRSSAPQ